jgi:uncharacterized membrane protein YgdD (TMEM256/DUF423 family)
MDRTFLLIGAIEGFLGVALGAFGAHGLRNRISAEMLAVFETGVRYQMYHAFAVLIVAAAMGRIGDARLLVFSGWAFVAGTILFSGSLYALALSGITMLGAVTPLGGLMFLTGWGVSSSSHWPDDIRLKNQPELSQRETGKSPDITGSDSHLDSV